MQDVQEIISKYYNHFESESIMEEDVEVSEINILCINIVGVVLLLSRVCI